MIITRLFGGLGNQMFQYAAGLQLAKIHNTELKLDLTFFDEEHVNSPRRNYDLDIFNISATIATQDEISRLAHRTKSPFVDKVFNKIFGYPKSYAKEQHYHFSPSILDLPDNVYLDGYWQSEKYFSTIRSELRNEFQFAGQMDDRAKEISKVILNTESVCVHVRRTDFLTNPLNGVYSQPYYQKADQLIKENISNPQYFVFSDDILWCKENLNFLYNAKFVDEVFEPTKFKDDLHLMSLCKHYVIANSSFSWWASWLNPSQNKTVIAPDKWVTDKSFITDDLYLDNWIRI